MSVLGYSIFCALLYNVQNANNMVLGDTRVKTTSAAKPCALAECNRSDKSQVGKFCCPKEDVALCEGEKFTDSCWTYSMKNSKCVTLSELNNQASSMKTFGSCVRVYENDNCLGKSIHLDRNSAISALTSRSMDNVISSFGECFSHDSCTSHRRRRKRATNNCSITFTNDELTVGFLPWLSRNTSNLQGPVNYFQIGPNSRTEVMSATIRVRNLGTGTVTNNASVAYARSMGNAGDDAGHILANRLGGSGTDLRNIFPQARNINRGSWARDVEGMVDLIVRQHGSATFTVNLVYGSRSATRPLRIVYRIEANGQVIVTNDMLNP